MRLLKEFKEFAVRGSVIDLAVGLIIGGAFGAIVNSLVKDVLMPPIGYLVGQVDFSQLAWVLRHATPASPDGLTPATAEVVIRYGAFLNTVISFLIVSFAVFLLVKQVNQLKRLEKPAPATTKKCPYCISVIDVKASRCPHCTSEVAGHATA